MLPVDREQRTQREQQQSLAGVSRVQEGSFGRHILTEAAAEENIPSGWLCGWPVACYLLPLIPRPVGHDGPREPKIQMENGAAMKVKLTTKQKRDRRWKIKRRKARREKHGV